ncbi:hypothetical protein scyTo_0020373, partial [Scyliorhinus torazame]|nr:hypothetical protein [Scyliorhinus torazame]
GKVSDTETRLECLLNNNKNSDFCAPLTSFDWNEVDPNLLGWSMKNAKKLEEPSRENRHKIENGCNANSELPWG